MGWMNDPETHSTWWEWDMAGVVAVEVFAQLPPPHVHQLSRVADDLGLGVIRVTRDESWQPDHLLQPLRNLLLAGIFEWGIGLHGVHSERHRAAGDAERVAQARAALYRKAGRQAFKDYVLLPALIRSRWRRTLAASVSANLLRDL